MVTISELLWQEINCQVGQMKTQSYQNYSVCFEADINPYQSTI